MPFFFNVLISDTKLNHLNNKRVPMKLWLIWILRLNCYFFIIIKMLPLSISSNSFHLSLFSFLFFHSLITLVTTQVITPRAKRNLLSAGLKYIISKEEMSLSILATGCICHGFSTMISNLVRIFSSLPLNLASSQSWYNEYYHGCSHELYVVKLGNRFQVCFSPPFLSL